MPTAIKWTFMGTVSSAGFVGKERHRRAHRPSPPPKHKPGSQFPFQEHLITQLRSETKKGRPSNSQRAASLGKAKRGLPDSGSNEDFQLWFLDPWKGGGRPGQDKEDHRRQ